MKPSRWAGRPRNGAIVAAAVAVMVCGAIWPAPIVGAGGALLAAVALGHGVRLFRTEQRPGPAAVVEPDTEQPTERCCVCGGPETPYENHVGQLFCWPCADCPCGQTPCIRTGINDPAVSAEAAKRDAELWMVASGAHPIAFAPTEQQADIALRGAAASFDAKAAALLEGVEDQAAFVAKANQHDASIWREAAAEIRAAMGAPADRSSR